ncbi:MAG: response regulator transcription factor [Flavobacteriales bacterium]|nr:MAG: response regulator transcription factor [Flavobacteriales bacterium]
MIKCVIVDDEPLAITLLEDHIKQVSDLQIMLSTTNPLEAMDCCMNTDIDLLFLDIQMPKLDGIEIMRLINNRCHIVVTSAYSEYAIHGFEHNIVDYTLKPITLGRFLAAITKTRDKLDTKQAIAQQDNFVYLKVEQRMHRINFDEILYAQGLRDYVLLYFDNNKVTVLQTMKGLMDILPATSFVRVHKSYIVAIKKVEQIHKDHIVVNNTIIPIGEFYREGFLSQVLNS